MKLLGHLVFGAALFLLPTSVLAQNTSPVEFVKEYVREVAAQADLRQSQLTAMETGSNSPSDCVYGFERFNFLLKNQISAISGYNVKALGQDIIPILVNTYQAKINLNSQFQEVCEAAMKSPDEKTDYDELSVRLPKIRAGMDELDKGLAEFSPLIFAVLLNQNSPKDQPARLLITKAQEEDLIQFIDDEFGDQLNLSDKNYSVASVAVIRGYLTKGFKTSDQP